MMNGKQWTKEEDALMRREYPHKWTRELAEALGRTERAVYSRATILNLHKTEEFQEETKKFYRACIINAGRKTRFTKGSIPKNKGKKIEDYMSPEAIERSKKHRFKKGNIPQNHKEVGYRRINKEGYMEMKVAEPNRFELYHRWLWQEHYGPIPKGMVITFINGDKTDVRIDNLQILTMKENMKRNTIHRYPEDLKSMIRLTGKLNRKIVARGKVGKGKSY